MIVKVGLDGQAYVDYAPVSLSELTGRLAELARAGGIVTYYRESPETDGSDAAAATFAAIVRMEPAILLGGDAPPEWGPLTWVELEEAPHVARFFLARGQRFLVSMPAEAASTDTPPILVGGPMSPGAESEWLAQVDLLVRSDRVVETPHNRPDLAMDEAARREPSLHLRIGHEQRRWASCYPRDAVPGHIESFRSDLWRLAARFAAGARRAGRPLSADEASRFFG